MNIASVKSSEKRFEIADLSSLFVKAYGKDNLYPQVLTTIIAASPTGSLCIKRKARFIEGRGFDDVNLYDYKVNRAGDTADDILKAIAADFAKFEGFALHVNYNILGQIVECTHVPFENCRLGFDDSTGYTGRIAVHPDWSGKSKRAGKALKVSVDTIDYIDVFNPLPSVVAAQIAAAGSVGNYKGQILYISSSGRHTYPVPIADCVITDMSTDEGLSNIRYRNVRNNFLPSGMFVIKKGNDYVEGTEQKFIENFASFQGDTNGNKIICVSVDSTENTPEFKKFESENFDKDFEKTTADIAEIIYATYEQEKFYRLRNGSLGFSSDIAAGVMNDYSETLSSEQRTIERALTSIFMHWNEIVSDNFSIIPLRKDETPDNQRADNRASTTN